MELNEEERRAYLNIEAENIIRNVNENPNGINSIWHPEYAKFMLECKEIKYWRLIKHCFCSLATPLEAYGRTFKSFLQVESNMRARREAISKHLGPQDRVISVANFPGLGTISAFKPSVIAAGITNEASRSCFIPDEVINSHARFK